MCVYSVDFVQVKVVGGVWILDDLLKVWVLGVMWIGVIVMVKIFDVVVERFGGQVGDGIVYVEIKGYQLSFEKQ